MVTKSTAVVPVKKGPAKAPTRAPSDEQISEVATLARRWLNASAAVEDAEEALRKAKATLERIETIDLPEAIAETGLSELKLATGEKVKVADDVSCGITAANQEAAFAWLTKHGYEGLIKAVVVTQFSAGDLERAQALVATLAKKKGLEVEFKRSVHPGTLKAFLKEQIAQRAKLPLDLFGARSYSRATVKLPPQSKGTK